MKMLPKRPIRVTDQSDAAAHLSHCRKRLQRLRAEAGAEPSAYDTGWAMCWTPRTGRYWEFSEPTRAAIRRF
jgi:hypothetical protein